jgi:gamma-glutamyl-gamma-aminobutyraldehyde dehydrogenase
MTLNLEPSAIRQAVEGTTLRKLAFIGGRFVPAIAGRTFTSEDPATGKPLADIAACDRDDVDRAATAARVAFESGVWSRRSPASRKKVLLKLAELVDHNAAELAVLDCLESGKPIADCVKIDVPESVNAINWHAEAIDKIYDHIAPTGAVLLGVSSHGTFR